MGNELLHGRDFSRDDRLDDPTIVAVNETLAAQYFPGEEAVGKLLRVRGREGNAEIVAVVADVRQAGAREPIRPSIYYSYTQRPVYTTSLVLMTEVDSAHIVAEARSAVAAIDPNQALFSIETMEQALAVEVSQERALSRLVGVAVPVAVLLAAAGLYGVLAARRPSSIPGKSASAWPWERTGETCWR